MTFCHHTLKAMIFQRFWTVYKCVTNANYRATFVKQQGFRKKDLHLPDKIFCHEFKI